MSPFIRSVSLYVVSPENILKWTIPEKETVKSLVSDGIKSGIVRPPISLESSVQTTPTKSIAKAQTIQQRSNSFVVSSSGSYAVVGEKSDLELDVAEWLAQKGAKTIHVCNPGLMNSPQYQQKVQGLKLRRNVNIQICNEQGLKRTVKKDNVKAIFFVNLVRSQILNFRF